VIFPMKAQVAVTPRRRVGRPDLAPVGSTGSCQRWSRNLAVNTMTVVSYYGAA
jgi:hypothetical protein